MENVITAIPFVSKEVQSFASSTIKVIPETERATIEQLASIQIKEPMFAVVEGERNYIYSFSKVFDGVNKEIEKIKGNKISNIGIAVASVIVAAICLVLLKHGSSSDSMPDFIGLCSTGIFLLSLWKLATTRYKKLINNLEVKKSYVLSESQAYLKNLDEEVKKPVVVV